MEITTEKIAFGGNCIGKIAGKNVFVPFAVPGEKLEIEIVESKRDYDVAKILKLLNLLKTAQNLCVLTTRNVVAAT